MQEEKQKKQEAMDIFVRYKMSARGKCKGITVDGIEARLFERGVPIAVTATEKKLIDDKYPDVFDIVESEKDIDTGEVKKTKPQNGIVSEKEIAAQETAKKPYDPKVDVNRDVTKEEARGLDRNEQEPLLKARKVSFKSTDKEEDLVLKILKSNPGYKS